jgi:hypothetical protein
VSPTGIVIDSAKLTNPQLAGIVNTKDYGGATNGMIGGCLPLGRYQINMVYPTGQAWTTPNEEGSCAASEGATTFSGANAPGAGFADDPLHISCATKPRPVLYSQGTRAVVEITAGTPGACAGFSPTAKVPVDLKGNPTDGSPFACSGLCLDPSLDPTALTKTGVPCALCLDKTLDPSTTPPCTTRLANPPSSTTGTDAGQ